MTTIQYADSLIPQHPVLGDVENVFAHESSATASRPQATDGWFFCASKLRFNVADRCMRYSPFGVNSRISRTVRSRVR